jgi:3-oxoacyl-[acyl-carrier protein] reductase
MSTKTCLLTGAGRRESIGRAIARDLAADGWDLALATWDPYDDSMSWGARPGDLSELVAEVEGLGRRARVYQADLSDAATPGRLVAEVRADLGPVTGLVLSHSQSVDSSILDTSVEAFDRHFAVNTRAAWLSIKAVAEQLPPLDELPDGARVVALTSDHTVHNLPYGASKGALDRIVVAAARELAHLGVSSNAVNPGPVDTGWMDDETRRTLTAMQPSGRLGTPDDVARTVRFLMSPEGRWVTGQLITTDGGFSV